MVWRVRVVGCFFHVDIITVALSTDLFHTLTTPTNFALTFLSMHVTTDCASRETLVNALYLRRRKNYGYDFSIVKLIIVVIFGI